MQVPLKVSNNNVHVNRICYEVTSVSDESATKPLSDQRTTTNVSARKSVKNRVSADENSQNYLRNK